MKIISVNHLKKIAFDPNEPEILQEFYISLSNGLARSDKRIHYDGRKFTIHHEIDDIFEELTFDEFLKTNIHKAILSGALYKFS